MDLRLETTNVGDDGVQYQNYAVLCFAADGTVVRQWDYLQVPVADFGSIAEQVRDDLLAQLRVRVIAPTPHVQMSPPLEGTHLVGTNAWFWVDPDSYESQSKSAADAAGLAVTLTAVPRELRFNTGDGEVTGKDAVVVCAGPGTPWQIGLDDDDTDCKFFYDYPSRLASGGTFTVFAEVDWVFTWEATGRLAAYLPAVSGTLGITTTAGEPTPLVVTEVQAVLG